MGFVNMVQVSIRIAALAALLSGAIACGGTSAPAAASLKVADNAKLGELVVDGGGRSLYSFGKDLPALDGKAVTNCSGGCATTWLAFHAANDVVDGINSLDLGEIVRADGSKQSTYRGWPLYYFSGDMNAGDTAGEGNSGLWFVVRPGGYTATLMGNPAGQAPKLYLADGTGHTLYYFFHDTPGTAGAAPISACTGACLNTWAVFHTPATQVPSTLASQDFSVFTRPDGTEQSVFKGHPLYFFIGDAAAGDTKGRGFNNLWDTLDPSAL